MRVSLFFFKSLTWIGSSLRGGMNEIIGSIRESGERDWIDRVADMHKTKTKT